MAFREVVNYTFYIYGEFQWVFVQNFVLSALAGIAITHAFRLVIKSFKIFSLHLKPVIAIAFASVVILSLLLSLASLVIAEIVYSPEKISLGQTLAFILGLAMNWVPVMTAWVIIYFLIHILEQNIHIREEKLQAENLAKTTELELLKIQLNPHFLFNALNSIKALVLIDAHKSRDAIIKLSELLRFTLNYEKNPLLPLKAELAEVEKYLALERIRFDERLRFSIEAEEDVSNYRIPPAAVLTLAENAIKHGISTLPGGGEIKIKAWKSKEYLYVDVVNTGVLKEPNPNGIGLKNVRQRMHKILGENAGCSIIQEAPDQVRCRLFYSLHSNAPYVP